MASSRAPAEPVRTGAPLPPASVLASAGSVIATTVTGLGYELVDVERGQRGLLQVFIDRIPGRVYPSGPGEFITVDDCELVTRQLQYVLEVEGLDYARLEVSSPGLDRPLRRLADFERFNGQQVALTLKLPFEGRKHWTGALHVVDGALSIVFKQGSQEQVLGFSLDELREARLVPVVDFKGRSTPSAKPNQEASPVEQDGGLDR